MNRKSSDGDFFGSLSSRGRIHNCPDRAPPLTGTDTLLSCSRTYDYSPTVTCKSPHRIRSDESAVDLSPAHYGHVDITRRTNIPHHYCYAPCKSVFCSDRTCRVAVWLKAGTSEREWLLGQASESGHYWPHFTSSHQFSE